MYRRGLLIVMFSVLLTYIQMHMALQHLIPYPFKLVYKTGDSICLLSQKTGSTFA